MNQKGSQAHELVHAEAVKTGARSPAPISTSTPEATPCPIAPSGLPFPGCTRTSKLRPGGPPRSSGSGKRSVDVASPSTACRTLAEELVSTVATPSITYPLHGPARTAQGSLQIIFP
jgi:hypothetical protein